jgi:hypothetical protein
MPYSSYGKHRMLNALKGTPLTAATAQATGDTVTFTAHGLNNNDVVWLTDLAGGTGLTASTPYYVISTAANTFQVSLTPGGSAVDITVNYTSLTVHRGAPITHAGLLTKGANITAVTSTGSPDTFTKTAHGLANGDIIVFSSITGGSGLVAGHPYYVVSTATNTFQIALVANGSAVDLTSDVTAATVNRLTEVTGGSPAYARKAIAFADAVAWVLDDSTNGAVFDVPAATVDYVSFHSALTGGPNQGIATVTQEVFAAQGTYTLTDAKLDQSL